MDLSQYKIIKQFYPFRTKIWREYFGTLENAILTYEKVYGKIDANDINFEIYYDEKKKRIGIVSTLVIKSIH